MHLPGAWQMRRKLLVSDGQPLQAQRAMPLHTISQQKGQLFALPEFGESRADTGIVANQADGYHVEFMAGQGRYPWVLAVDLHRTEKAVGIKGPYRQGSVECGHRATAFLPFGWPLRCPRSDA